MIQIKDSPHIKKGLGKQVGIITLWTKKEHVMKWVPEELYAVISQLYSRDEGISTLVRNLFKNPSIRDLIITGVDLNKCSDTLIALWERGVINGQVVGAPGYVDVEIPSEDITFITKQVKLHDLRHVKDYSIIADYIRSLEVKQPWGSPKIFPETKIRPPSLFPNPYTNNIRCETIKEAIIDIGHRASRFGDLYNVHIHITNPVSMMPDSKYKEHFLKSMEGTYGEVISEKKSSVINTLKKQVISSIRFDNPWSIQSITFYKTDKLHLSVSIESTDLEEITYLIDSLYHLLCDVSTIINQQSGTITLDIVLLHAKPANIISELCSSANVLKRTGDPRSNLLIRIKGNKIVVTHLSPDGKRLEEFSGETAKELYKRIIVEHRITDLSHAAYVGYELARAEHALKTGGFYEQDSV